MPVTRSESHIRADLALLAQDLLPQARHSLHYASLYAAASGHPQAVWAADLEAEQALLLDQITRADLIPFGEDDAEYIRRAWLDAAIERIHLRDPRLTRYFDLHEHRREFLPAEH